MKVLPEGDKNEMDTAAAELGHNHSNTDVRVPGGLTELVHNQAKTGPSAVKKKIWAKGKNGLFSWKTQKAAKTSHANKYPTHTSHSGLKFTGRSDSESTSKSFSNWLLTARGGRGVGGGGEIDQQREKNENEHTMKIMISGAKNL